MRPHAASAMLFSDPEAAHPDVFCAALSGSPGFEYALQPAEDCGFYLLHQGEVTLKLTPDSLPLPAHAFSGGFDAGFGDLSRLERQAAISGHNSHVQLSHSRMDVAPKVISDVLCWLSDALSPDQIFWGETSAMFSVAHFRRLTGQNAQHPIAELTIIPRRFRSGFHYDGIELKGFHADGAEDIFGMPVSVAQGPLGFEDAFAALKDLAIEFRTNGAHAQELKHRQNAHVSLVETPDLHIIATRVRTSGVNAHDRILIRCEDAAILNLEPGEEDATTSQPDREESLRRALRA